MTGTSDAQLTSGQLQIIFANGKFSVLLISNSVQFFYSISGVLLWSVGLAWICGLRIVVKPSSFETVPVLCLFVIKCKCWIHSEGTWYSHAVSVLWLTWDGTSTLITSQRFIGWNMSTLRFTGNGLDVDLGQHPCRTLRDFELKLKTSSQTTAFKPNCLSVLSQSHYLSLLMTGCKPHSDSEQNHLFIHSFVIHLFWWWSSSQGNSSTIKHEYSIKWHLKTLFLLSMLALANTQHVEVCKGATRMCWLGSSIRSRQSGTVPVNSIKKNNKKNPETTKHNSSTKQ